jgi:hypothetical protein
MVVFFFFAASGPVSFVLGGLRELGLLLLWFFFFFLYLMKFLLHSSQKKQRSPYDFRLHNTSIQLGSKNAHWIFFLAKKSNEYMDLIECDVYVHLTIYTIWHRLKVLPQEIRHFSSVDLDGEWCGSHQIAYGQGKLNLKSAT